MTDFQGTAYHHEEQAMRLLAGLPGSAATSARTVTMEAVIAQGHATLALSLRTAEATEEARQRRGRTIEAPPAVDPGGHVVAWLPLIDVDDEPDPEGFVFAHPLTGPQVYVRAEDLRPGPGLE